MSLLVRMIVFALGLVMMAKAIVMGIIEGILGIHSHDPPKDGGQADWLTSRANTTPQSLATNSPDQIERLAASRHVDANAIHELRSHRIKITPTLNAVKHFMRRHLTG